MIARAGWNVFFSNPLKILDVELANVRVSEIAKWRLAYLKGPFSSTAKPAITYSMTRMDAFACSRNLAHGWKRGTDG